MKTKTNKLCLWIVNDIHQCGRQVKDFEDALKEAREIALDLALYSETTGITGFVIFDQNNRLKYTLSVDELGRVDWTCHSPINKRAK